jgi:DNA-binding GntR family transcriptional regulator
MNAQLAPIALTRGAILGDEVYASISAAILDGRLAPGEKLRDVDLAAQLGVSRTPVREALQRLERFGLVEVAVGRYTRVSEPDEKLRADTAAFTIYLLGNGLHLALRTASDEELAGILTAADALISASRDRDPAALFEGSTTLFRLVTRATRNGVFIHHIRETQIAIMRSLRGWAPFTATPLARPEGYVGLRDAIAARDAAGAEAALRWVHGIEH